MICLSTILILYLMACVLAYRWIRETSAVPWMKAQRRVALMEYLNDTGDEPASW